MKNKMALDQLLSLGDLFTNSFLEIDNRLRYLLDAKISVGIKRVIVIGDGDSYHAAVSSTSLFNKFTDIDYLALPAMKFLAYEHDYVKNYSPGQTLLVGVSASGGSKRVVQCLEKAKANMPWTITLALTGNVNSPVANAAALVFNCSIPSIASAPGIRSYVASMFGLSSIAFRISELHYINHMTKLNGIRKQISELGKSVDNLVNMSLKEVQNIKDFSSSGFIMTCGTGNNFGSALFFAAKFVEIGGILAVADDIEEWLHVGRFSYPIESPLFIIAPKSTSYSHAIELAIEAKKIGHPVYLITNVKDVKEKSINYTIQIPFDLDDSLFQLVSFIPSIALAINASDKLDRKMFQSDNEEISIGRNELNSRLKESM